MKGQGLIDGTLAGYSPDELRVMNLALERAWALIEQRYPVTKRDAARLRLADSIVDVSPRSGADVDTVQRMAVDLFMILDRDEPLG